MDCEKMAPGSKLKAQGKLAEALLKKKPVFDPSKQKKIINLKRWEFYFKL